MKISISFFSIDERDQKSRAKVSSLKMKPIGRQNQTSFRFTQSQTIVL